VFIVAISPLGKNSHKKHEKHEKELKRREEK
jgi:hypothetical protein